MALLLTTPLPSIVKGILSKQATPSELIVSLGSTCSYGFFLGLSSAGGFLSKPAKVTTSPG
jgi:hypothetical protein